jgi:hypothetical protein
MNAVEIEQAVTELFSAPFDPAEFPYAFLQAFGNKETTLRKLRTGDTNKSDRGGLLQRNNIHIAIAPRGEVSATLAALHASPATGKHKVKFILAADGERVEAEELGGGTPLECSWSELPDHFGFFLPLAGISTVKEIRDNAFDIRATSKLNRLYIELLKDNPEWGTDERRPAMNHFMARLIFSFFAEDTGIFADSGLFTKTISQMSEKDSSNTHHVIGAVFCAMNTKHGDREAAGVPRWADRLPYVNGGLFSGAIEVPRFSRTARSYLLQVGSLDWRQINPDIFGSMIQAVADDDERGALGMHYTSVPNILKVLNPLFLDDLRAKLEEANDNPRKLLNLRSRINRIRVFDPACGSGNFLVIAYKEMRAIEQEINRRRGEVGLKSEIPLTNFRGIELRDFAAEIARLALIIAEFQCDELYRGQQEALNDFLPLDADNWITCGNALRLDWSAICPPTGTSVKLVGDDLFSTPLDQSEIEFENHGGETYVCGNPPYLGNKKQTEEQKADLEAVAGGTIPNWRSLDYVSGWVLKAAEYGSRGSVATAFVTTNSLCQGQQVPLVWPYVFERGYVISFAHTSFLWSNLAAHNAGVTVVIVGFTRSITGPRRLISTTGGTAIERTVPFINAYLVPGPDVVVDSRPVPANGLAEMCFGNMPRDGGMLLMSMEDRDRLVAADPAAEPFLLQYAGSEDAIHGSSRICIWIEDSEVSRAARVPKIVERLEAVRANRKAMKASSTQRYADRPHRFVQIQGRAVAHSFLVPRVSSERRGYLPVALYDARTIVADSAFALYDAPLWNLALIASRLHLVWIATVCGKLKADFRYSNTLGWNTFPVPPLTEQNKADLTRRAEEILLAREAHFPATIADLYDPEQMPTNLREAHERNDEVLERIYIGRIFRNDTERLEKLFDMYPKMTANGQRPASGRSQRKTR